MKSVIVALIIVCVAAAAGTILYLNRHQTPPTPALVAESSPGTMEPEPPATGAVPKPEPPRMVAGNIHAAAPIPGTNSVPENLKPKAATQLSQAIDDLLSPQITAKEKHALFQRLQKAGELDRVIAELKQRATDSPNDPEIPTTLGEAQLNQLRSIATAGGDPNDIGILAMQADQSFNAALKLDPANWEAQFVKAQSMSFWPLELNKGQEVIQRFSSLIDQQETLPPQPLFAQTYVLLGDEYQKLGQPDYAAKTWQLGAQKFPNDPTLQKRISNPSGQ